MRLDISTVARSVDDTDFADLTTAKRTGSAVWVDDGVLEIPFDRDLTPAEADAVALRLTTQDSAEEQLRKALEAYLQLTSPTAAQNAAVLKPLARLALRLLDKRVE